MAKNGGNADGGPGGGAGPNPVISTIFTKEKGQSNDWPFGFLPFDSLRLTLFPCKRFLFDALVRSPYVPYDTEAIGC